MFGAGFGFSGLFRPILRGCVGFKRDQEASRDTGYIIDSGEEGRFVSFGRLVEAADLSYELKGGGADFGFGKGRIKLKESFNVAAHFSN